VEAITKTDAAVGTIYEACKEAGYILLITADHGNAEQMINLETGAPHTAHTTNPVPFIMTADPAKYHFTEDKPSEDEEAGALCDVAPTVLDFLVRPYVFASVGRTDHACTLPSATGLTQTTRHINLFSPTQTETDDLFH
jgi:2,3-bisphosphoglycerate-independent phosphoglycerate mutase